MLSHVKWDSCWKPVNDKFSEAGESKLIHSKIHVLSICHPVS